MTEFGKSLKDEGRKEKTVEVVKSAVKKGIDNETIKESKNKDIFTRYMDKNPNIQRMTELGRSLFKEGFEKGYKQELQKGMTKLLMKQLEKKFKKVPYEYKEKIEKLPYEKVELIILDIFELKSIEELEKYY